MSAPAKSELDAANCWVSTDHVTGRPDITAFKQGARLRQARWRHDAGLPIGSSPYNPRSVGVGRGPRPIGSRIEYEVALAEGRNLLSDLAREAAARRKRERQNHQTLLWDRLWCDCLSSMPLCFNLFGPLSVDLELAQRAVDAWFPEAPGRVMDVILEWSPARRDPHYLNDGTAFDAAIILDTGDGTFGLIGIETKYYEHLGLVKGRRDGMPTYRHVAERSEVFRPSAIDQIVGSPLEQIWRDHLLALSMLTLPETAWIWGKFVVVYPARNLSIAEGVEEYRALLSDSATFGDRTLESLLTADALPAELAGPIADRYVW